ncbi:TetR/AcrR family transcriptional regulator [Herbihabitans rhizosphaerae]|nr:TetR/AcrR family transcriptional regulator [Herbihabitans rhizosphaerae]
MTERTTGSIRARVRAEMLDEIKAAARKQLATDGASLSLRAVARDMGMASSAIYRYFPSRDDLLTALIIEAYDSLADAAEDSEAEVDRADLVGRWLAVAHGLRNWALDRPHEYALIYGSPVPGYAAPEDTIEPSTRPVLLIGTILTDAKTAGRLEEESLPTRTPAPLVMEIREAARVVNAAVGEAEMARALIAWTELFGAISFEIFGRLNNVIDQRFAWFDHQMRAMAGFVGLR